jgi:hypothetical protein
MMFTLAMVPMFGLIGLVTDFGYMHFIKMSAQTAAEAAAQAAIIDFHATVGGSSYSCGTGSGSAPCSATPSTCTSNITTPSNSLEHGCMYAQAHGFNGSNQWVTYEAGVSGLPPNVSGMSSTSYWVTFWAIEKVPMMFSAILGNTSGLVAARSSAAVVGSSDCIYALNPNASGAVSVGGTARLTASCGIYVDSNSSSALSTNGSATLSATEYDVVGKTSTHNPLTPAANTGVIPVSDPLANLPVPSTAPYTCDYYNYNASNWSNPTLYPGVYCGGINVGNNTYTLNPGNYILVGGGLSTQSANSTLNGTNVFFYNTFDPTSKDKTLSTYAPISISANSNVNLTAPVSGTYAGILFFEDRSAPASSDSYGGGSSAIYQGTIYAKNAAVTMYGNSSVTAYTLLVADTVSLVGTSGFNNNYSTLPNGSPIQKVVVLE